MSMTASAGTATEEQLGRLAAAIAEELATDGRMAGPASVQESPSQLVVDDQVAGVWSTLEGGLVVTIIAAVDHLPAGVGGDEAALIALLSGPLAAGAAVCGMQPGPIEAFIGLDTLAGVFAPLGGTPVVVGSGIFLGDVAVASVGVLAPDATAVGMAPVVTADQTPPVTPSGGGLNLALIADVELEVSAELGSTRLPMAELLALQPGSIVELDRPQGAPVDVLVNGTLIARGEVIVVDDAYAVRVTEVVSERHER
jgi:flagellar motor switch protein FliN/FliY